MKVLISCSRWFGITIEKRSWCFELEKILDALERAYADMIESESFDASRFKNSMEKVFESEGYCDGESKNILIVHDGGVGDLINCSPAIKAIRNAFPDSEITLVAYPRGKDLLRDCPYIDRLILNERNFVWNAFDQLLRWDIDFSKKLLPYRFDVAFCFCLYVSGILLSYMCGAKKVVGYENDFLCRTKIFDYEPMLQFISERCSPPQNRSNLHQVDCYLGLVEGFLNKIIVDRDLEVWLDEEDVGTARDLLSGIDCENEFLILLSMGATGVRKQYPPEKYAQLARKISEEIPDARFVIIGGERDVESSERFMRVFESDRVLDLAGKINFRVSAAIASMTNMYLGNDTSTAHLAAAAEIPCLVPNCFPMQKKIEDNFPILISQPYRVPLVVVQPLKPLPECADIVEEFGCIVWNEHHCIDQISVDKMFEGFLLLREKILRDIRSTTYIC